MPKGIYIFPPHINARTCKGCAKTFYPPTTQQRHCSYECARSINGYSVEPEPKWWLKSGYLTCTVFYNGERITIRKHRWVVEKRLGRLLTPLEAVHHINENKTDNRDENLEVLTHGAHTHKTNLSRDYAAESQRRRAIKWPQLMK